MFARLQDISVDNTRLLRRMLRATLLVAGVMTVVVLFLPNGLRFNLQVSAGVIGTCLVLLLLLERGYVAVACWGYLIFLLAFAHGMNAIVGGVFGPYPAMFGVLVLASAIMLGTRAATAFTGLAVVSLLSQWAFPPYIDFTFATESLMIQRRTVHLIIYIMVLVLTLLLINHAVRLIEQYTRQLRASEVRFRQVFEQAPIGIALVSTDNRVIESNAAFRKMYGFTDAELVNIDALNATTLEEDADLHQQRLQSLLGNEASVIRFETTVKRKTGEPFFARITASSVLDRNKIAYLIAMVEDITEARAAEQHRIDLLVERERMAVLRNFVSHMTHDLKTPLTAIGTSFHLYQRQPDPDAQERHKQRVEEAMDHLKTMINNMLHVVRLDDLPALETEPVALDDVLRQVERELLPLAQRKSVHLTCMGEPLRMDGNFDELHRALVNLIHNAIKYTPEGGTVNVTLAGEAEHVRVTVRDTGIGIAPDDLPHIFEEYYRTEDARGGYQGTGLGLSIVQRVVTLHRGTVDVTSEPGQGTTFTLTFPRADTPVEA